MYGNIYIYIYILCIWWSRQVCVLFVVYQYIIMQGGSKRTRMTKIKNKTKIKRNPYLYIYVCKLQKCSNLKRTLEIHHFAVFTVGHSFIVLSRDKTL